MREIKFKFYNKATGEFIEECGMWWNYIEYLDQSQVLVCQYTGLKDKNGQEIYEGDMVEPVPNAEIKYVVRWNDYRCGFWLVHPHHKTHEGYILELFIEPFERQVIGNIYENPELLEAKDATSDS